MRLPNGSFTYVIFLSYLYAWGKGVWKKWKKRYYVLVQVSQYTFAMCSYKEKKTEPSEMFQLDGYTVDYIEAASGKFILKKNCSFVKVSAPKWHAQWIFKRPVVKYFIVIAILNRGICQKFRHFVWDAIFNANELSQRLCEIDGVCKVKINFLFDIFMPRTANLMVGMGKFNRFWHASRKRSIFCDYFYYYWPPQKRSGRWSIFLQRCQRRRQCGFCSWRWSRIPPLGHGPLPSDRAIS